MNLFSEPKSYNVLRILIFCSQYKPLVGGAERQAEKLSHALLRRGHHVEIVTPLLVPETPLLENEKGLIVRRFPLFHLCKRFPLLRGLGPINLGLMWTQTDRYLRDILPGFDIVHAHSASPLLVAVARVAHNYRKKILCKASIADARSDIGEVERIGISGRFVARKLRDQVDFWIATTKAVGVSLVAAGVKSKRIGYIPNGVFIPKTNSHIGSLVARRFLYLGRLSTNIRRDTPTLIRAFDRLSDEVSGLELAIVGNGDLFEDTLNLVNAIKHNDKVKLPGLQEPQSWLDWADCFVLPSRREGLSNALLEAMAEGLPCIANDIPPNREVLDNGQAGILVPVGDEDALYRAMKILATIPGESDRLGRLARTRAEEEYAIDSVAARCIELYGQVIATNSSQGTLR